MVLGATDRAYFGGVFPPQTCASWPAEIVLVCGTRVLKSCFHSSIAHVLGRLVFLVLWHAAHFGLTHGVFWEPLESATHIWVHIICSHNVGVMLGR